MSAAGPHDDARKHWLVRRQTIRGLWIGSGVALTIAVLFDLVIERHDIFVIDGTFGFAAWYGFVTCVAMILGAKALSVLLKRSDSYYRDG